MSLSLVSVETQAAYPLITGQLVRGDVQESAPKAAKPKNLTPRADRKKIGKTWRFPELLNVAVMVKTNLKTGRCAKVLLFSDDLALARGTLIAYYPLRFQIGFTSGMPSNTW